MSQYSELSDLLHLTLISQAPDSAWPCRPASSPPLTSGSVGSYSGDTEPFEIYASEDQDAVLEIQVITVAENVRSGDWRRAIGCFVPPLFLTSVHSITLMSPLFCHWNSSSFLFSTYRLANITADPLICRLGWYSTLLFLCLVSSSGTLASLSPTCRELNFFSVCSSSSFFPIALLCTILKTKHIIAPCGPLAS